MRGIEYFVYMVRCSNGALYTGMTTDVERRVAEHNAARGARYTRLNAPVELVWTEVHPGRSSAIKREAQIKRLPRAKKLGLIGELTTHSKTKQVKAGEHPASKKRTNRP
jgi:predicted GIY-YIG superfamily endonuclease